MTKKLRNFMFKVGVVFGYLVLAAPVSFAAVRTWDGGATDNNWSSCQNWSSNLCPGTADVATFDGTSTKASTVSASTSVKGVDINAGYTGTITQNDGTTLTIGSSNYAQDTGTFVGSSTGTLALSSSFILAGGTFTAPLSMSVGNDWTHNTGTGIFLPNNGTVTFNGTANSNVNFSSSIATSGIFYNVTLNKAGLNDNLTIAVGDTLTVQNTLNLTDGQLVRSISAPYGLINAQGDFTAGTLDASNIPIEFTGSTTLQSVNLGSSTDALDGGVTINKSGGTVQLQSNFLLNASSEDFTLSSGEFKLNGNQCSVKAQFTMSGGTFTGDTGILDLDGYFTLSGGSFVAAKTMYVAKNWTHTAGGSFDNNAAENATVIFDTEADSVVDVDNTLTGAGIFYNVTLNKNAAGSGIIDNLQLASADSMTIQGNFHIIDGEFTKGPLSTPGTIYLQGNLTVDSAASPADGWITFSGTQALQTIELASADVLEGTLTLNKTTGTLQLLQSTQLDGLLQDLVLVSGTLDLNGKTLEVRNSFEMIGGILEGGTGTLDFNENFEQTGGTFNAPAQTTIAGNWNQTGGSFNANSGTVIFDGTISSELDCDNAQTDGCLFYNLQINKTSSSLDNFTLLTGETLSIEGLLTLTDGKLRNDSPGTPGTLTIKGDLTVGASFSASAAPLLFSGTANQEIDASANANVLNGDWTINKSSGTVTLLSSLTLDATFQILTIQSGSFYLNGNDFNLNGAGGRLIVASSGVLQLNGNEILSLDENSPLLESGSTVEYVGSAGDYSIENFPYQNLTVNGVDGVFTLSDEDTLDVDGNFTLQAGTFSAPALMTIAGNWIHSGGTFTANEGTVTLDGTAQSFTGSTSFYDLNKNTETSDTLSFPAGATQTITHTLDLEGSSEGTLSLRSSSSGTAALIDPQGFSTVTYLDVKDSLNQNAIVLSCLTGCIDSGNNTRWLFSLTESSPTVPETTNTSTTTSTGGGAGGGMSSSSHSRSGDSETNNSTSESSSTATNSTSETSLSDLGLTLPKGHWSTGYINYLVEKEGIAESAKSNADFLDLLHILCDSPDYTASRGDIVEFLIFLTELDPETSYENTRPEFLDADSSDPQWKYIEMAYQLGLVDGYPDGLFRSKQIINRAETLKMVMRFFKEDVGEKIFGQKLLVRYDLDVTPLPDIDVKEWYAPYTLFGYTKGVVHGYKDGTFGPANSVSFAELLKIALLTQDIDHAVELSSELE